MAVAFYQRRERFHGLLVPTGQSTFGNDGGHMKRKNSRVSSTNAPVTGKGYYCSKHADDRQ